MASSDPRMVFIVFFRFDKFRPSDSYKLYSYKSVKVRVELITFSFRVQVANHQASEID